jgi:hypothetical protein
VEAVVVLVILAALAGLVVPLVGTICQDAELTICRALLVTVREAICGTGGAPGFLSDMATVPGFVAADMGLQDLFEGSSYPEYDLETRRGWRGPYLLPGRGVENSNAARQGRFPAALEVRFAGDETFLARGFFTDATTSPYGVPGDRALGDPWGNPVVLQVPPDPDGRVVPAERFRYARLVSAGPDGDLETPLDFLAGRLADGTAPDRGDDLVLFLSRGDCHESR